jgi:hypothetical protein
MLESQPEHDAHGQGDWWRHESARTYQEAKDEDDARKHSCAVVLANLIGSEDSSPSIFLAANQVTANGDASD